MRVCACVCACKCGGCTVLNSLLDTLTKSCVAKRDD